MDTKLRALACATVAAFAGGCGEDEPTAETKKAKRKLPAITFQVTGDPEETAVYARLVEEYASDSGAAVEVLEVADRDAHLAKLTTGFSAGKQPDLFLINYRNVGGFADKQVIDPAGPRLDASTAFERADFYEIPLTAFEYGGVLQCMPQNVSSLAVYYNADAFEKAGLAKPAKGFTYRDFTRAAAKVGVGIDVNLIRTSPWIWAAGGELVDDETSPTKFRFSTPEGLRGLNNLLALRRRGWSPTADEADSKGVDERFLDGELGMFLSSRRDVPLLRTIERFEWDVAPFPKDREEASVLHSDGFCVSKGDKADAAWAFTEWALGPKGQEILAESGRTVPSLKSVAQSPAFLDPDAAPASSQVFLDAIEYMHRLPTTKNWTEIEGRANDVLESLYYGKVSVDKALRRLATETDGGF